MIRATNLLPTLWSELLTCFLLFSQSYYLSSCFVFITASFLPHLSSSHLIITQTSQFRTGITNPIDFSNLLYTWQPPITPLPRRFLSKWTKYQSLKTKQYHHFHHHLFKFRPMLGPYQYLCFRICFDNHILVLLPPLEISYAEFNEDSAVHLFFNKALVFNF